MAKENIGAPYIGIVDDDDSLCRAIARLLRAAGMRPVTYSSAEEFRADTKLRHFDCLIFDIQLPGITGLQLLKQLVNDGVEIPVLFLTALDDPKAREQAMEGGCSGYFLKTDAGSELLDAIRRIVSHTATE